MSEANILGIQKEILVDAMLKTALLQFHRNLLLDSKKEVVDQCIAKTANEIEAIMEKMIVMFLPPEAKEILVPELEKIANEVKIKFKSSIYQLYIEDESLLEISTKVLKDCKGQY